MTPEIKALTDQLKLAIESETDTDAKIELLNQVRYELHTVSPLRHHPVDYVFWEKSTQVEANEYNPNKVAPPEWTMLNQSIEQDGYTMSIVAHREAEGIKIVDGFHRRLVERTNPTVSASTFGRVPLTQIRQSVADKGGRMASTILHNRARGSHNIELMSQIVAELVEMGKGDAWICKHVGMSADELLRLKQITGLAALFTNKDFSQSWEVEGHDEMSMTFEDEN
jgi:ParB-like chromosome segregation protein Spo0J